MTSAALGDEVLDQAVATLRASSLSWSTLPVAERIGLLERLMLNVVESAGEMTEPAALAKGYSADSTWAAEDWVSGPWAVIQTARAYLTALGRIAAGQDLIDAGAVGGHAGRVTVTAFPATGWDTALFSGYSAQVWMQPGITAPEVLAGAGGQYRERRPDPGVALVLGAGNAAAITALDILHKLYVDGQVVVAKMNPVNAYLRTAFERIFAEFIERGWVRFVDGAAAEGSYLAAHGDVDAIHVTGSARTHDAIVWGVDEQASQRRHDDRPLIGKPFTSELGGVSPWIVVPGRWSSGDFRFQAEQIVTSKLNNSGHNCIATQVLVVPRRWEGTARLLDEIRRLLVALPPRADYYPGAQARLDAVRDAHAAAEAYGDGCSRLLVPDITDHEDLLLSQEVFASALGVVRLDGTDTVGYLRSAVDFANDVLPGTLGATVIADPRTLAAERDAMRAAMADLRYGTVGLNCWSALGFLLGYAPWGAYPGHTRQDIGSGTGFVHNAMMLENVEKTVVRAPFAPFPRGLLTRAPSLSPRPPYFVTSRTSRVAMERLTRFTADRSLPRLPALMWSALRS